MTRRQTLKCVHEPFGDAFYYGPERLSGRYEEDERGRIDSGFSKSTFRTVVDRLDREGSEVRLFPPDAESFMRTISIGCPCASHPLINVSTFSSPVLRHIDLARS